MVQKKKINKKFCIKSLQAFCTKILFQIQLKINLPIIKNLNSENKRSCILSNNILHKYFEKK